MDPVTVSVKECVTIAFSLCPYGIQRQVCSFLSLRFTCILPKWWTQNPKATKQCHVTCRSQLNRALRVRNAKQISISVYLDSLLLKILVDISSYYSFLQFYSSLCLLLRGSFDWKHMPNTLQCIFIHWKIFTQTCYYFVQSTPYFVFSTLLSMFGNVIKQHLSCLICCFKNYNFWF